MPKANPTYTTMTLRRKFEECPLLIAGAYPWFCGSIDGEFEISADVANPAQWWISDTWLTCHNGKTGREAAANTINLHADTDRHFYLMVLDSIDRKYGRRVPEWLDDEMALLDIRAPLEAA